MFHRFLHLIEQTLSYLGDSHQPQPIAPSPPSPKNRLQTEFLRSPSPFAHSEEKKEAEEKKGVGISSTASVFPNPSPSSHTCDEKNMFSLTPPPISLSFPMPYEKWRMLLKEIEPNLPLRHSILLNSKELGQENKRAQENPIPNLPILYRRKESQGYFHTLSQALTQYYPFSSRAICVKSLEESSFWNLWWGASHILFVISSRETVLSLPSLAVLYCKERSKLKHLSLLLCDHPSFSLQQPAGKKWLWNAIKQKISSINLLPSS